ncbi:MAG: hypothetical protein MZV63_24770 [Marinilabiliales bacterium]|nr:hypothetical protein [Marinilabiliales bacterium]
MSFTSAMTYDFEVYSAAQQRWLEVSSTSNFESFQANRLKCRFREKGCKTDYPLSHTERERTGPATYRCLHSSRTTRPLKG